MMLPLIVALLFAGSVPASAAEAVTNGAPCWIQDVAAVGGAAWLLCDREKVFSSRDGGATWRAVTVPSDARLRAIAFLDAERGFIAGDNGTLLASRDAGQTWTAVSVPTEEHFRDIEFSGNSGWIGGYGGTILYSGDEGRTWTRQPVAQSVSIEDLFFLDQNKGWAVGWNGTILRTTDGGRHWQQVQAPDALWTLSSVFFRDGLNGWAAGMSGQLLRTRDAGVTWEAQEPPVKSWFTSVYFDGRGRGWITSDSEILMSEDGGESWHESGQLDRQFLERMVSVGGKLWAVGPFGILEKEPSGVAWRQLQTLRGSS